MFDVRENLVEKIIAPPPMIIMSFSGFAYYIFEYLYGADRLHLVIVSSVICFCATLLMLRPRIRAFFRPPVTYKKTTFDIMDTPDEVLERKQRRIDADSHYYGMVIFILAVLYLAFLEVV